MRTNKKQKRYKKKQNKASYGTHRTWREEEKKTNAKKVIKSLNV